MIFPQIEYKELMPCVCCDEMVPAKEGRIVDGDLFFCNPCVDEQIEWLP